MNFMNIRFPSIIKILIVFLLGMLLIRLIPMLIVGGIVLWISFKCIKYFKEPAKQKNTQQETQRVHHKSSVYDDKSNFDFSNKNVVDVEYEEIKK